MKDGGGDGVMLCKLANKDVIKPLKVYIHYDWSHLKLILCHYSYFSMDTI